MTMSSACRRLVSGCVVAALLSTIGCSGSEKNRARHFDFSGFAAATQITIVGIGGVTVGVVTDRNRVQAAASYFVGKEDGWTESWRGPTAGVVALRFANNSRFIGEFQIDKDYLVYGAYHVMVPPEEIDRLVQTLDVDVFHLPKR